MRKKCGIQGEENEVDGRNTNQGNRDTRLTQNNADRNSEGRLNQTEDDASSDNNDVRNDDEDSALLQTSYKTPIDIAVSSSSELLDVIVTHPNRIHGLQLHSDLITETDITANTIRNCCNNYRRRCSHAPRDI